jgi:hypothetical protein
VPIRYEDVVQDGRVRLVILPEGFSVLWLTQLASHPVYQVMESEGVIPILTRLVLEGGGGPVGVVAPLSARSRLQLAHTVDDRNEVRRILLNMWTTLTGTVGRTYPPAPPNAGAPVEVGRAFAENTFTRPFAPPGQRGVRSLPVFGVPEDQHPSSPPRALLELPPGAEPVDRDLRAGSATVFGLDQTDSNLHVTSLTYPSWFIEEALRRFQERDLSAAVLARYCDIRFRKPCFAGDRVRTVLRAYVRDGRQGVYGFLARDGEDPVEEAAPMCTVRLEFE